MGNQASAALALSDAPLGTWGEAVKLTRDAHSAEMRAQPLISAMPTLQTSELRKRRAFNRTFQTHLPCLTV